MSPIVIMIIYLVTVNDRSSAAVANVNDKVNIKGHAALHEAVKEGNRDEVNLLIEKGANVNIPDRDGQTPLHVAVEEGHIYVVDVLVHHGVNINSVNKFGETPLHNAARAGDEQITNVLIRNGANVNAKNIFEITPLHFAADKGFETVVSSLIDAGADINAISFDLTPLMGAVVMGRIKAAEILIKRGASVNIQNEEGRTALHHAVMHDNEGMVSLLMKSGANPDIKERYGKTPIDLATEKGNSRIVDLLKQRRNTGSANEACVTYSASASDRIANGELAERGEFPWMAALGYVDTTIVARIVYLCGGTIISDYFILTAAHCTKEDQQPVFVRFGKISLTDKGSDDENRAEIRRVHEIHQHPDYKVTEKKNDISLIRLKRRIIFSDDVRPACLQTDLRDESPSVKIIVSGWGDLNATTPNKLGLLRKTDLVTMPLSRCNTTLLEWNQEVNEKFLRNGLSESQYCAYDPNGMKDSCAGDSGGPLQLFSTGARLPKVVGIVSIGIGCASSLPGVYTRVAFYIKWIESIVWPNGFNTAT